MSSTRNPGPSTQGHDMSPLVGIRLTKVNVLRRLEPAGSSLTTHDLKRRMAGASMEDIEQAVKELLEEGMLEVAYRSTDQGKRFYVPPKK